MRKHAAKYPVPEMLKQLQAFDEFIQQETGNTLDDYMGIQFQYDEAEQEVDFAYPCDPVDSILMASTGWDGLHFSFLTDFGTVRDLEHAPIVFVEPICHEYHVSLVAANIKDFLRMFITTKNILSLRPEDDSYKNDDISEDCVYICRRMAEYFGLTPFEDPVVYRRELLERREVAAVLPTRNGIGVMQVSSDSAHESFEVDEDVDVELEELKIKAFFSEASIESKLACIRDLQESTDMWYELAIFLMEELQVDGFVEEAHMMKIIAGSDPEQDDRFFYTIPMTYT